MTPAPQHPDNPAHDLSQTLARQADRFTEAGGSPLELDQVLSRAGEIRRGRRMRATMVMAAVAVAVAVPVGISTLTNDDPTRTPVQPAASTPPAPGPIRIDGLKSGSLPAQGYYQAGTLHYGDVEIPVGKGGEVRGLTRINGGFLVERQSSSGDLAVTFLGDDREAGPDKSWPTDGGVAVSPDGNVGAFVQPDGTVVAVQDAGARYFEIAKIPTGSGFVAGAVTGENCSGRSEEAQCVVFVNERDETNKVWAVSPFEGAADAATKLRSVNDFDEGRTAGIDSVTDTGSCSAVEGVDGQTLWSTCEEQLKSFSPDGRHLLGVQAYGDGLGDSQLVVLDADTGQKAIDLRVAAGVTLRTIAWEDDDHVLALVADGNRFAVIRFGLDGSRELALPISTGVDETSPPFLVPGD